MSEHLNIADLYITLMLLCKFVCLTRSVIGSRDERRKGKRSARSRKRKFVSSIAIKVTNLVSLDHGGKVVLRRPLTYRCIYIYSDFRSNREEKFALWEIPQYLNISPNAGQPTSHIYSFVDREVLCSINSSKSIFFQETNLFLNLNSSSDSKKIFFLFCFYFKLSRQNTSMILQSAAFLWLLDQSIAWDKIAFGSLRT